ncbi:MAG TPA: hypothetical protein VIN74_04905 [Candidatus Limnocylindria bacterium]|jgi:hypothetical protein
MRALAPIVIVSLITGCGPSATTTPSESLLAAGAPCPVTTAPPTTVTPPPSVGTGPNPTLTFTAGPGNFLYGNDALIVILPNDGTLHPSDPARGLPAGVKFPWWRGARGDLTVATRRLDANTTPQAADVPGGYGDTGFQVSGLNFPAPGCWQVTGTISGRAVTFVVNVVGR